MTVPASGVPRSAAEPSVLPTILLMHPREKAVKCTVQCLRAREGFQFCTHPYIPEIPAGYVRLGLGGPLLSAADSHSGLLVLDGTWRLASRMEPFVRHVPVRTLPAWRTAYPRVSKFYRDPSDGLATIEAIFAAYHILGRDTAGLLDEYHWREQFLELNGLKTI